MPQNTPNLNLELFDEVLDKLELFKTFRTAVAGTNDSNFQIIDTAIQDNINAITAIKGAGYTNETLVDNKNAIDTLENKGIYTAVASGINSLTATVSELSSIDNNVVLKLIPSAKNTSTVTLDTNSDGVLPVVKVRNVSGSTIYTPLDEGDLQPNQPIFVTKSSDGIRYLMINFGELYARNVFYDNGDDTFTDIQTKTTDINNKILNSFARDANDYAGNQKLGDDGQDVNLWTSGTGTLSQDTVNVKIGSGSIKLLEDDNLSSTLGATKNNISLDFTKLDNGEISSDDDFIVIDLYVSDVTKVSATGVIIAFGQDAVYSAANRKRIAIPASQLVTGWNYIKFKKSDATTDGSGAWSGIQSLSFNWITAVSAQNSYISLQLVQLVKKHPTLDQPHYLQRNGVSEFNVNSGEWYVGKEFGVDVIKELGEASFTRLALTGVKKYKDFIANFITSTLTGTASAWHSVEIDTNNYISVQLDDNLLKIREVIGGVTTDHSFVQDLEYQGNDIVEIKIEKDGSKISVEGRIGSTIVKGSIITSLDGEFSLSLGTGQTTYIYIPSITEIPYSARSGIAEVAKSLVEQPRARVYNNANQSIPNTLATELLFTTSRFDNRNHFNLNEPGKLTIRESGLYSIVGSVRFASNATSYRQLRIVKNSTIIANDVRNAVQTTYTSLNVSTIDYFEVGDTISLHAVQLSGAALNVESVGNYSPELTIVKIS